MALLVQMVSGGLLLWMVGLALVFAIVTLSPTRQSPMSGGLLLTQTAHESRMAGAAEPVAPERVLSAVVFPTIIIYYTFTTLTTGAGTPPRLPDIPDALLALLTGSNSIYLAAKAARG